MQQQSSITTTASEGTYSKEASLSKEDLEKEKAKDKLIKKQFSSSKKGGKQ
jgi:hypothetical protein